MDPLLLGTRKKVKDANDKWQYSAECERVRRSFLPIFQEINFYSKRLAHFTVLARQGTMDGTVYRKGNVY
jgi:hypothetical protein